MLTPRHRALFEASYSTLLVRRAPGSSDSGRSSGPDAAQVDPHNSHTRNDLMSKAKPGDSPAPPSR